jgi:hypothetical protein
VLAEGAHVTHKRHRGTCGEGVRSVPCDQFRHRPTIGSRRGDHEGRVDRMQALARGRIVDDTIKVHLALQHREERQATTIAKRMAHDERATRLSTVLVTDLAQASRDARQVGPLRWKESPARQEAHGSMGGRRPSAYLHEGDETGATAAQLQCAYRSHVNSVQRGDGFPSETVPYACVFADVPQLPTRPSKEQREPTRAWRAADANVLIRHGSFHTLHLGALPSTRAGGL